MTKTVWCPARTGKDIRVSGPAIKDTQVTFARRQDVQRG
jgi:hypothetical protein